MYQFQQKFRTRLMRFPIDLFTFHQRQMKTRYFREHMKVFTSSGSSKCLTNLTHEANIALSTSSCTARRTEGTHVVPSKQTPFP